MITLENEVVGHSNVMDILGMPQEKSVNQLLDEAVKGKETALAQYERILYKMGMRRSELNEELTKLNKQFGQIEYLLQDTKKALGVLKGESELPKPHRREQQITQPVSQASANPPRRQLPSQTFIQQVIQAFRETGEDSLSAREITEICGFAPHSIRNFLYGPNKNLGLLELSETTYKPNNNAAQFYRLTLQYRK
jgi:hypothetical protein